MGINSKIEWCHHTLNFWWGCSRVSDACRYCYADAWNKFSGRGRADWSANGKRWIRDNAFGDLAKLAEIAKSAPERQRVFVNSMSDTFEDHPALEDVRRRAFYAMDRRREMDFLLLTKRPENVLRMAPRDWLLCWPRHVWIGATVENQAAADKRIPELAKIPARVRFLSMEPLLERVDLHYVCFNGSDSFGTTPGIHWVICGGESGPHARPMNPDWVRDLRAQCVLARVPFFFKQWGEWVRDAELTKGCDPKDSTLVPFGDGDPANFRRVYRVGKKRAGRMLDGREHSDFPRT